jgi:hypothetical protein
MTAPSHRYAFIVSCSALFLYLALSLASAGSGMFLDTDPFWHIAAGDLIRAHHAIPKTDPWSFTTGDHPWFNISWAWDATLSFLIEQGGWRAAAALNAVTIALTLTLMYALGTLVSGSAFSALITSFAAITMFSLHLRPLQMTDLMTALWLFILSSTLREKISTRWLALLPFSMILWVNVHGGFLTGFMVLAAFFAEALWRKQRQRAKQLFWTGLASGLAALCNPYGIHIIKAVLQPINDTAGVFIKEWQPLALSAHNLMLNAYALVFLFLVPRRTLPISTAERWLAYFWLLMGVMHERHMFIFAVVSIPAMASTIRQLLPLAKPFALTARMALIQMYGRKWLAGIGLFLSLALSLWLPSPLAGKIYSQVEPPVKTLDAEIAFIEKHYPKTRFLNHFDLGGIIIYATRGSLPVFIDPRTQTAYPTEVIADYVKFKKAAPGWEEMLDRYRIGGLIVANNDEEGMLERFENHRKWKEVFKGQGATVFIRWP